MPLYQYRCNECQHEYKNMRRVDARNEPAPCPECGHEHAELVIGTPAVAYNQPGLVKTSNNFNDRLKEIKDNVPNSAKGNIEKAIR